MTEGQETLTHKVGNNDGSILNSDPWTECKAILYMFLKEYLKINVCFR